MNEQEQRLLEAARATLEDEKLLSLHQEWHDSGYLKNIEPYYKDKISRQLALWHIIQEYDNERT